MRSIPFLFCLLAAVSACGSVSPCPVGPCDTGAISDEIDCKLERNHAACQRHESRSPLNPATTIDAGVWPGAAITTQDRNWREADRCESLYSNLCLQKPGERLRYWPVDFRAEYHYLDACVPDEFAASRDLFCSACLEECLSIAARTGYAQWPHKATIRTVPGRYKGPLKRGYTVECNPWDPTAHRRR